MIQVADSEDGGHVGVGDGFRLGDEIAERAGDVRDLAVDGQGVAELDPAEQEKDHDREDEGELDRRYRPLVALPDGGRSAMILRRRSPWERLVLEGGRGREQMVAVGEVRIVEAEELRKSRPFVEGADDDDVAAFIHQEAEVRCQFAGPSIGGGRLIEVEGRERLHVELSARSSSRT